MSFFMLGNTYIERLCDALGDVLDRAANGTKDRLAGYVANLDFWASEAEHRLRLIREYDDRFHKFQAAQEKVAAQGEPKWDERQWVPPPVEVERSASWNQLKEARRKVVAAMGRFLARGLKEGMIDETMRSSIAARVN